MEGNKSIKVFIAEVNFYDDNWKESVQHMIIQGASILDVMSKITNWYDMEHCTRVEIIPIYNDDETIELSKESYEAIKREYCD